MNMNAGTPDPRSMEVFHRGVIMPWECDDMGHLNIRFHAARYGQALRQAAAAGAPFAKPGLRRLSDRCNFLKEARVSTAIACSLAVHAACDEAQCVIGILWDMRNGDVLSRFETRFGKEDAPARDGSGSSAWVDADRGHELPTAMGLFAQDAADPFARLEYLTAAVSDANAICVLEMARGTEYAVGRGGIGFVVAELLFSHGADTDCPRLYKTKSALLGRSTRSLTFRHRITHGDGQGGPTAVRSACVFFDLKRRVATPMPFEPPLDSALR